MRAVTDSTDESVPTLRRDRIFIYGGEAGWQLLEEREGDPAVLAGSPGGAEAWGTGGAYSTYVFSGSPGTGGYVDDAVAFRFNPARGGFASDSKRFLRRRSAVGRVGSESGTHGLASRGSRRGPVGWTRGRFRSRGGICAEPGAIHLHSAALRCTSHEIGHAEGSAARPVAQRLIQEAFRIRVRPSIPIANARLPLPSSAASHDVQKPRTRAPNRAPAARYAADRDGASSRLSPKDASSHPHTGLNENNSSITSKVSHNPPGELMPSRPP